MVNEDNDRPGRFAITTRPNRSLPPRQCLMVYGALNGVILGVATAFGVILGAWPILPFAGLEALALSLGALWVWRHEADYERLTIEGSLLVVEARRGSAVERREFNGRWAQVVLRCGRSGNGCRLAIRSHGRETAFGRFLSDEERSWLAGEIRLRVGGRDVT